MSNKIQGVISILAALLVIFTAMANPVTSATIATLALLGLGAYNFYVKDEVVSNNFVKPMEFSDKHPAAINSEQIKQKREHLQKILGLAKTAGEASNDAVQIMLGVSEADAEHYLQELERQGKLARAGGTGKQMTFRLK
jgi:predicted HTH transcriptional regulator